MPRSVSQFLADIRKGDGLDQRHILTYGRLLLALELAAFLFFAAGTHGLIVPLKRPTTTDFVSFYAAGALANAGTPADAYDQPRHFVAEQAAAQPGIKYVHFYYPPVFLIICNTLARLPYLAAFILFVTGTLGLFLWTACRILQTYEAPALVALLAFPAVLWTIGFGQNSLLTAALFGAATLLIDRRPIVSGLLFGAICYKPHLGLLIPVALAAGGYWRTFAAAALSVAGLVLVSLALYGWPTWQSFFTALAASPTTYQTGTVDDNAFVNPYGAALVLGGSLATAYGAQIFGALVAGLLVAFAWFKRLSLPTRAATLIAATIVMAPVVLFYDLTLAAIAAAWLIRSGRQSSFFPWEKFILTGLYLVPAVSRYVAKMWHLPIGSLVPLVLLALAFTHARRECTLRRQGEDNLISPGASERRLARLPR